MVVFSNIHCPAMFLPLTGAFSTTYCFTLPLDIFYFSFTLLSGHFLPFYPAMGFILPYNAVLPYHEAFSLSFIFMLWDIWDVFYQSYHAMGAFSTTVLLCCEYFYHTALFYPAMMGGGGLHVLLCHEIFVLKNSALV